jgi:hypothetical protein
MYTYMHMYVCVHVCMYVASLYCTLIRSERMYTYMSKYIFTKNAVILHMNSERRCMYMRTFVYRVST